MVAIYVLFPGLSLYSCIALFITFHQFFLMFNAIGYAIPIRFLFGAFMCLQMLLGPTLAYNGLDEYQFIAYKMKITEAAYFSYVIPAVICFIIGLHINAGKLKGEIINEKVIEEFIIQNKQIPYIFIGIGFIASILSVFLPSGLGFVFVLLGGFKFVGAFMIIAGNQKLKPLPLMIVFGSIISSSLGAGMFHDLITWIIFLGYVFAVKFKPSMTVKRICVVVFILTAVIIQQLKGDYRQATWTGGEEGGLAAISKTYTANQKSGELFKFEKLAASNVRINQGFIITNIMLTVPRLVPFAEGKELYQILEAALLPRILAPNKLNAGDRDIFIKYSGIQIQKGTSMALSSVGDAYINFGILGGSIFMFFLGLLFNEVLKAFHKYSKYYPILILFTPIVFYYPIRPDCELQTILGHLVKSVFLIFVIMQGWKKVFKINTNENSAPQFKPQIIPTAS